MLNTRTLALLLAACPAATVAFRSASAYTPHLRLCMSSFSSSPSSTLTSSASTPIYAYLSVESTQTTARELLLSRTDQANQSAPFSVLAGSQGLGRGTNSRTWISPPDNLYLTVVVPSSKLLVPGAFPLSLVPLKVGTVVHSAITKVLPSAAAASVSLKWPNDVLVDGKKVAGVLIEMDRNCFLIGVGCNVGVAPTVAKEGRELGREAGRLLDYCYAEGDASNGNGTGSGNAHGIKPEGVKAIIAELADTITSDIHVWAENCEGTGDQVVEDFSRHVEFNRRIQMRTENGEGGGRGRWVTPLNLERDGRLRVRVEGGGVEILTSDYTI